MSPPPALIGDSPDITAILAEIRRLLPRLARGHRAPTILLQGETGTGKGLLARWLHSASPGPMARSST